MTAGKRRTPPANTGRAVRELAEGSDQQYQAASHNSRRPAATYKGSGAFHWATQGDFGVITCRGGEAHVAVILHGGEHLVSLVRNRRASSANLISRHETAGAAIRSAENEAAKVGLDSLARPGPWRRKRATRNQITTLRQRGIPFTAGITTSEAADRIALGIARSIDPIQMIERSAAS